MNREKIGKYFTADTGKQAGALTPIVFLAVKTPALNYRLNVVTLSVSCDQFTMFEIGTATIGDISGGSALAIQTEDIGSRYVSKMAALSGNATTPITVANPIVNRTFFKGPDVIDVPYWEFTVFEPGQVFFIRSTQNISGFVSGWIRWWEAQ